jgi:uncharacterized membrane protein
MISNKKDRTFRIDLPLLIMLVATLSSFIFWTLFTTRMYNSYSNSGFFDLGQYTSSFTYMVHYPSIVHGLQYFVISTHVAFDQLLLLPFFYLFPYPATLLVIQALVVSLTGLLAFLVAKDLLGNPKMALALGLAVLLTPGLQGLFVFDYHAEMLIVPFLILTFYFYMKRRTVPFAISLVLLLATIDTVVFIVASLGVGFLYYEMRYCGKDKASNHRRKLALVMITAALVALLLYVAYANMLESSYASGAYGGLPPYLRILPLDKLAVSTAMSTQNRISLSQFPIFSSATANNSYLSFSAFGILFGILIFGVAMFADPILTILIISPWLGELILLRRFLYGSINFQYFSYVIGGSFAAAVLGIMLMQNGKGLIRFTKLRRRIKLDPLVVKSILFISFFAIILGLLIRFTSPQVASTFFGSNPLSQGCDSGINYLIATLPKNSVIMTESPISPHISTFKYPEVFGSGWYNRTPDYVIADFNTTCLPMLNMISYSYEYANFTNYKNTNSLILYERNGSASVYRFK